MKRILFLAVICAASLSVAAQYKASWKDSYPIDGSRDFTVPAVMQPMAPLFSVENGEVLFVRTYRMPGYSAKRIRELFLLESRFGGRTENITDVYPEDIDGDYKFKIMFKELGYRRRDIPRTLRYAVAHGEVVIQIHDEAYRVIAHVRGISYYFQGKNLMLIEKNNKIFRRIYLKRSKRKGMEVLNRLFTANFSVLPSPTLISDWK